MKPRTTMNFNFAALGQVLGMYPEAARTCLRDGRFGSFVVEYRLVKDNPGWRKAAAENLGYDLLDPEGQQWELRCVTQNGVNFNPSAKIGTQRKFDKASLSDKMTKLKGGYIFADIVDIPLVTVYMAPIAIVLKWVDEKKIGAVAKVSRSVFISRLVPDLPK